MKLARTVTHLVCAISLGIALSLSQACAETLEKKAIETIIPKLELREVTPADALKAITTATGIQVFYNPRPGEQSRITVSLSNIPASESFKYIAQLANLNVAYEEKGVRVTSR